MSAAKVESARKPTKNKVSDEDQIYELLLAFQEELIFESYCLFEDMHQIHEYIIGVWVEYRANNIDLMTASLRTNVAIDMIKLTEANITSRAPSLFPDKEAYWRFLSMLQLDQALQHGYDLDYHLAGTKLLEIPAFDDFLYLPTARTAAAMYNQYQAKVMYPQLIMPARTGYVARPELLELPKHKQTQVEHERLVHMLMDMTFYLDCSSRYDKEKTDPKWQSPRARSNYVTKAAAAMKFDGEFSVWIIFTNDATRMRKRDIDPNARMPPETQATADKLDIFNDIKPAEDPLHMYTNSPLACGTALFDLRLWHRVPYVEKVYGHVG